MKLWIKAGEYGWVDSNDPAVEIEDLSEDPYGADVYTFTYNGETYQSRAYLGYSPPG